MKYIVAILLIFLGLDSISSNASIGQRYVKIKLKKSPSYQDFVEVVGHFCYDNSLKVDFIDEKKYELKIYYLGKESDTLKPMMNLYPKIFYTNPMNVSIINCELTLKPYHMSNHYKKYNLIFDFYHNGKLISKYISEKKIRL